MNDIQRLEMLSESIKNEIDELESLLQQSDTFTLKTKKRSFEKAIQNIISNLNSSNDGVYNIFEELNATDNSEELKKENEILKELIREKTDYDEKTYIRLKHGIELW